MSIGKPAWKKLNSGEGADIYSYHWIKQKKKVERPRGEQGRGAGTSGVKGKSVVDILRILPEPPSGYADQATGSLSFGIHQHKDAI